MMIERASGRLNPIRKNLARWQDEGLVPEMPIKPGDKTDEPIRTRGWTHWHHLFSPRALLVIGLLGRANRAPIGMLEVARNADRLAKLCRYNANPQPTQGPKIEQVFSNQALNPLINYGVYSFAGLDNYSTKLSNSPIPQANNVIETRPASLCVTSPNYFVTDPPYADAIRYEEITEFFIAWLRKNPVPPFDQWTWELVPRSGHQGQGRKVPARHGGGLCGDDPPHATIGMQVVMFTHQDAGVWADLGAILWAAGLRVSAAWNVVTETESALKEGNYVQGTVCLVLRKRLGEANARRMEIEAEIEEDRCGAAFPPHRPRRYMA